MGQINISIIQLASNIGEVEQNINKVESIVSKELSSNTDVLVLPEVWTVGWSCSNFIASAQELENSMAIKFLSKLAKEYNVNIIGGSIISKKDNKYYNTCPVLNRNGETIAIYNKNHLYSYYGCDEGKYISAGENPVMVEIEGVNYGLSICYDIRFPELYRAYAKAGADILVNCAAWGASKPIPWEMMTKSRAIENQCYMIALTQCGHIKNEEYNLGESRIIDYKGEVISEIKEKEGIVNATVSLDDMYKFREKCKILNDIKDKYEVKIQCAN